jgi:hypothetical protein
MININKIRQIEESKRQIRKEIYKKIFEQFSRKIQVSVDAGQKQTVLQVPEFLIGYPSYDVIKAAVYLKRQLELSGFQVSEISMSTFHVAWFIKRQKVSEPLPPRYPEPPSFSDEQLPSLINLKKAAKRYSTTPS